MEHVKRLKTGGRQKGTANKATREFRDIVRQLLERNADNVERWLGRVAADDPAKALDMLVKLAEFTTPKMSRTEVAGSCAYSLECGAWDLKRLTTQRSSLDRNGYLHQNPAQQGRPCRPRASWGC